MDWEAFYNNFRTPDFIPGYEIQNRLGGGAFGDVYKARKHSIGKPFAVKFLKIEDDGQREAVERELAQVRHFAAIDHPNLVSIEDLGTAMGVPYLIMGYAGEETLARRLKLGRLEPETALLCFVQACRGVLALHDRRLVHFDLKPSNIFLKGDVARVGDYGLSKLLTDGRMTLSFGRGTPQYMAPEMLRSRADHRADIYSLGVILFECLAGELPFASDAQSGLVLREDDVPPGFPAGFPARLRAPVEQCLRLAPADRYDTVSALLEDLDQTARQGDSVRIDLGQPPVTGADRVPSPEPSSDGVMTPERPTPSSTNEELKATAADLARGAVEVARGVLGGIAGREVEPAAPGAAVREATPAGGEAGTKAETPVPSPPAASPGETAGAAAARIAALRDRGDVQAPQAPVPLARIAESPEPPGPASGIHPAGTIPVPPRVEGGLVGAFFSTILLGFEVLVALVASFLRGGLRLFRGTGDRLLRTSGGLAMRATRLLAFVFLMTLLGFGVMTIGMLFLDAFGVRT